MKAEAKLGRDRASWPIIEGIDRAAAMLHAPVAMVRLAKLNGSKAFLRGGRVDTAILIPELFDMLVVGSDLPPGVATWREAWEREKAKRESIKRAQDEKSVMPTSDARRMNGEAWAFVFDKVDQLCNEAPPEWAGRNAVELFSRLVEFRELLRKDAKEKFESAA